MLLSYWECYQLVKTQLYNTQSQLLKPNNIQKCFVFYKKSFFHDEISARNALITMGVARIFYNVCQRVWCLWTHPRYNKSKCTNLSLPLPQNKSTPTVCTVVCWCPFSYNPKLCMSDFDTPPSKPYLVPPPTTTLFVSCPSLVWNEPLKQLILLKFWVDAINDELLSKFH